MRVYISVDVEGIAGVVDWDQVRGDSAAYHAMCRLTTLETNEAIEGALAGGATEIIVNDSHGPMRNLLPELLHPTAELIQGRHKPMFMVEGLDESCDALFLVGYHGRAGSAHGTRTTFPASAIADTAPELTPRLAPYDLLLLCTRAEATPRARTATPRTARDCGGRRSAATSARSRRTSVTPTARSSSVASPPEPMS